MPENHDTADAANQVAHIRAGPMDEMVNALRPRVPDHKLLPIAEVRARAAAGETVRHFVYVAKCAVLV